ncbi:MAG: hypothetical protein J6D20_01390 [Clostridia bacterium]|nr:hypothetical protein [Clostridia bacterium]
MHNHKFSRTFVRFSAKLSAFLPSVFWILLIYGFDEALPAGITVISAVIHELGHEAYLVLGKNNNLELRTTLSGFRIKKARTGSYLTDAFTYASGPIANIFAAVIIMPFKLFPDEYKTLFIDLNLITAASNLLPVRSYDGYGIITSLLKHYGTEDKYLPIVDNISFSIIVFLALLSLYIVGKVGGSYWMAGLFIILLIGEVAERIK